MSEGGPRMGFYVDLVVFSGNRNGREATVRIRIKFDLGDITAIKVKGINQTGHCAFVRG